VFFSILFIVMVMSLSGLAYIKKFSSSSYVAPITQIIPDPVAKFEPVTSTYKTTIAFMGDVMLDRSIGAGILNGVSPFKEVDDFLSKFDIRVANIETVIADPAVASKASGKLYTFNAPVESIQSLIDINLDVAVLANNHTKDYGPAATLDMLKRFNSAKLSTVGAGVNNQDAFKPLVRMVAPSQNNTEDFNVAFLAFNDIENYYTDSSDTVAGSAYFNEVKVSEAIASARKLADIVIVIPHWGAEYTANPNSRQVEWAHNFIDMGADIVIGGHPHVTQTMELYKKKTIIYSLGNFIFDGMSGDALKGAVASMEITSTFTTRQDTVEPEKTVTITNVLQYPISINRLGHPELAGEAY
jgi:poly-gamma-glutamate capsule biosynthesis protein CapA/YwtB (metallophosphatase superfamily)